MSKMQNPPQADWQLKALNAFKEFLAEPDTARDEQYAEIRRKTGRYSLEEAAEIIAKEAGAGYTQIYDKLVRDAESHVLTSYMPCSNAPQEYGSGKGQYQKVSSHIECDWEGLNDWLKVKIPLVKYRFPNPDVSPAAGKVKVERSITKQRAINAFDGLHLDRNGWNNALSDVPKWIEPCRVSRGRKGDKSTSATWNPVLIAVALFDKNIPIKNLDAVFVRLPDWAEEWRETSESFLD